MRSTLLTARAALVVVALAVLPACRSTEPLPVPPLAGTYEFTTVLDTFSFETPAPSPPDCPAATLYCTHFRADTNGRLSGTLTVGDQITITGGDTTYTLVAATIAGRFCDAIDRVTLTGCTHVRDVATMSYSRGEIEGRPLTSGERYARIQGPDNQGLSIAARFSPDSIVGRVYWTEFVTRSPPAYRGSFKAYRLR
jgi:hypothetical protein